MFTIFNAECPPRVYPNTTKYPFADMKPVQAFTVPANHPAAEQNAYGGCSIASSAYSWGRRNDAVFSTRRNTDDSITVYRVE